MVIYGDIWGIAKMNSYQAEEFILLHSRKLWGQYRVMYPELPPDMPQVKCINKACKSAGVAYYNLAKGVEYNIAFLCSLDDERDFIEVIAHELAHCIQFRLYPRAKQAHGVVFKEIMQSIGYAGHTYHSFSVSKAKEISKELKTIDLLTDLGF